MSRSDSVGVCQTALMAPSPGPAQVSPLSPAPTPAPGSGEDSSSPVLLVSGVALLLLAAVGLAILFYTRSPGGEGNDGRSTVHVAPNEAEIVSQAERGSDAQTTEEQESNNDNNNEEVHDQREGTENQSDQVIPASAASPAIAGSAGERSAMPARARGDNNNVWPPSSASAMPVQQQLGVRQNQRPAPFASALPMPRQAGAGAAPFLGQQALPTNATGLELNNSIPTNALWPSSSPSFGIPPPLQQEQQQQYDNVFPRSATLMQQQQQPQLFPSTTTQGVRMQVPTGQNFQGYGNIFPTSATPMQQQQQQQQQQLFPSTTAQGARMQVPTGQNFQGYGNIFPTSASPMQQQQQQQQLFPSTTAQGARMQVPAWQNFQGSAQSSITVINENPEDQRIFKTCQARVGAWQRLEIDASQVTESVLLGEGAYAEVFKGVLFGTDCAIKKYRSTASTRHLELAHREIRLTGGSGRLPLSSPSLLLFSCLSFSFFCPFSSVSYVSAFEKYNSRILPASLDHPCTLRLLAWARHPLQTITELCRGDLKDFYLGKIRTILYTEAVALRLLMVRLLPPPTPFTAFRGMQTHPPSPPHRVLRKAPLGFSTFTPWASSTVISSPPTS